VVHSFAALQVVSLLWNVQTALTVAWHGPLLHRVNVHPVGATAVIDALHFRCAGMQFSNPNALTIAQSTSVL